MLKLQSLPMSGSRTLLSKIQFLFIFMLVTSFANAQKSWDGGAGTTLWSDANNWDPDGLPTITDAVTIGAFTIDINSTVASVKTITMTGSTLSLDAMGILLIDIGGTYAIELNSASLNNSGDIQITNCSGGIGLKGTGSSLANGGSISVDNYNGAGIQFVSGSSGGTVNNSNMMSFDNGTIATNIAAITFSTNAQFTNNGIITIGSTSNAAPGISFTFGGTFTNNNTLTIVNTGAAKAGINSGFAPGTVLNNSSATINFGAGIGGSIIGGFNLNLTNDGIINTDKPGTVNANTKGIGTFGGSKPFENSHNFAPGNSGTGCLTFNSGYSNIAGSPTPVTLIEIGGTTPCTQYDKIGVTGTANITGTLTISLLNGFMPTAGETYTFLEASSRVGTYTTINYPTVPGINWTISYTGTGITVNAVSSLPVELTRFTATKNENNTVQLDWQTASESNNRGFSVERMTDRGQWAEIDFVKGIGTTTKEQQYALLDENPLPGLNYYRLRQMDFDGKEELSKVVSIDFPGFENLESLVLAPNPTNGIFELIGDLPADAIVSITDSFGRLVKQIKPSDGFSFDLNGYESGVYSVQIIVGNQIISHRIIKQD